MSRSSSRSSVPKMPFLKVRPALRFMNQLVLVHVVVKIEEDVISDTTVKILAGDKRDILLC